MSSSPCSGRWSSRPSPPCPGCCCTDSCPAGQTPPRIGHPHRTRRRHDHRAARDLRDRRDRSGHPGRAATPRRDRPAGQTAPATPARLHDRCVGMARSCSGALHQVPRVSRATHQPVAVSRAATILPPSDASAGHSPAASVASRTAQTTARWAQRCASTGRPARSAAARAAATARTLFHPAEPTAVRAASLCTSPNTERAPRNVQLRVPCTPRVRAAAAAAPVERGGRLGPWKGACAGSRRRPGAGAPRPPDPIGRKPQPCAEPPCSSPSPPPRWPSASPSRPWPPLPRRHPRPWPIFAGSGQPVIDWNRRLIAILGTPDTQPATVHPTRSFAMLQAAEYDAVVSITAAAPRRTGSAVPAPDGARPDAAADQAAHDVLVALYPGKRADLDAQLQRRAGRHPGRAGQERRRRGRAPRPAQIVALRDGDGSAAPPPPFAAGTAPGDYRPTPPETGRADVHRLGFSHAVRAHQPAAVPAGRPARGRQPRVCRRARRGARPSAATPAPSAPRTRPWPGSSGASAPIWTTWNQIAQQVATDRHTGLAETTAVFSAMDLALADTTIAMYDAKYADHVWRPVTADPERCDRRQSGHHRRPDWNPLTPTAADPSYPGAHSALSEAAATVLTAFFGPQQAVSVTSAADPGVTRTLHRLHRGGGRGGVEPDLGRPAHPARPRGGPAAGAPGRRGGAGRPAGPPGGVTAQRPSSPTARPHRRPRGTAERDRRYPHPCRRGDRCNPAAYPVRECARR